VVLVAAVLLLLRAFQPAHAISEGSKTGSKTVRRQWILLDNIGHEKSLTPLEKPGEGVYWWRWGRVEL